MAGNTDFEQISRPPQPQLPVGGNETAEVEPVGRNEVRRAPPPNAADVAAYEGEVAREEESIGSEFEEIGTKNAAEIREGLLMSYNSDLYSDTLSFERTAAYRNSMVRTLTMEKEDLADGSGPMGQAIDAQIAALNNNWGVNDMDLIRDFALSVALQKDEALKKQGQEILDRIAGSYVPTVDVRNRLLSEIEAYCASMAVPEKDAPENRESSVLMTRVEAAKLRDLHYTEFPEDETVHDIANRNGAFDPLIEGVNGVRTGKMNAKIGGPVRNYIRLETNYMALAMEHNRKSFEEKQKIRGKGSYVMQKSENVEGERFQLNYVQYLAGITVSNRNAAKSVFGDAVFDGSDALREQPTRTDRTVPLHNAKGNQALLNGENVLEIDVSGSGLHLAERDYHGFAGNTYGGKRMDIWEQPISLQYGERIKLKGFEDCHSIRKKETNITVGGKRVNKTRYTIPGPMPKPTKNGLFRGLLDVGKYKIENSRGMTMRIAQDYLTPIFEQWKAEKEKNPAFEPKDVRINITGYSRGAVSADGSVKAIREWIDKHEEYRAFANKVKYTAIFYDPVPGPDGAAKGYASQDLRKDGKADPNLDVTLFHSLSVNHPSFFTPQSLLGASRIILGTTLHACTQDGVDNSQRGIVGDGKAHRRGFYDTATGECYRGSGLSDLPKGVYFSDEKQNLVRLTSYAQLPRLIESLGLDKAATSKSWKRSLINTKENARYQQNDRRDVICNTVKTFLLDNPLDISYESEHERAYENKRLDGIVEDLLSEQPAKGSLDRRSLEAFGRLQEALRAYDDAEKSGAEVKECRDRVLREAAAFMRADKGDPKAAKRMGRVSDLYSLLQRNQVYDEKGLTPSKGRQNLTEATCAAQRGKAKRRYQKLEAAERTLGQMKEAANSLLQRLITSHKDGKNSELYNKMCRSVQKVVDLSADASTIDDIKKAAANMAKAAATYARERSTGVFHTRSKDGLYRISIARNVADAAERFVSYLGEDLKGIFQTDRTIADCKDFQNVRIQELNDIGARLAREKQEKKAEEEKHDRPPERQSDKAEVKNAPEQAAYTAYTSQLNLQNPTDQDAAKLIAATAVLYDTSGKGAGRMDPNRIDSLAEVIRGEAAFQAMMQDPRTQENIKNGRADRLIENLSERRAAMMKDDAALRSAPQDSVKAAEQSKPAENLSASSEQKHVHLRKN